MNTSPVSSSTSTANAFSSAKSESGKANAAKRCSTFEPQQWRQGLCKNCFRTAEQHENNVESPGAVKLKPEDTDQSAQYDFSGDSDSQQESDNQSGRQTSPVIQNA
jgi:hypothetical protein